MHILNGSCSVIGTLSKEVYSLRIRCQSILSSILISRDESLLKRLRNELTNLEKRRAEIFNMASSMRNEENLDRLSVELLLEIASRPLNYYPNMI